MLLNRLMCIFQICFLRDYAVIVTDDPKKMNHFKTLSLIRYIILVSGNSNHLNDTDLTKVLHKYPGDILAEKYHALF